MLKGKIMEVNISITIISRWSVVPRNPEESVRYSTVNYPASKRNKTYRGTVSSRCLGERGGKL